VPYSAVQYVREQVGLQVCAIATLDDLLTYLENQDGSGELATHLPSVQAYRERYGVKNQANQ
jgi:orotate phosphoribosyltransferase